jgi:hypothetical protein
MVGRTFVWRGVYKFIYESGAVTLWWEGKHGTKVQSPYRSSRGGQRNGQAGPDEEDDSELVWAWGNDRSVGPADGYKRGGCGIARGEPSVEF